MSKKDLPLRRTLDAADVAGVSGNQGEFSYGLARLKYWRDDLIGAISAYQEWVERQNLADGERDLRVYELIEALRSDKITIALAAECSRGKSELLNAMFFTDSKQRLLPSGSGRTTMCPTELRYDEKEPPCIKLLPIETRTTTLTISEYKQTPIHWTTIHLLKPNYDAEVREAFLEVTRTKKVHVHAAQELGLYNPTPARRAGDPAPESGMIEIPVWRHAVINFPHPLLKQGLVVLDTPGLNVLGVESELTLSMLPGAAALLFVLGTDTGVTQSDLDVWNQCTQSATRRHHLVVLNKIDMLWDELNDEGAIAATIARQANESARHLGVDRSRVFPVSAQKGLVGRIKNDLALLERSGLLALEAKIAQDIIPARHTLLRDRIVHELSTHVESGLALLRSKQTALEREIQELRQLSGKNLDVIQKLIEHVNQERQKYDKEVEGFQLTRAALTEQANVLLSHLSMKSLDELIAGTRRDMHESWTTLGLQRGMATFFQGTAERMEQVQRQAENIRQVVERLYQRLHTEYGLAAMHPAALALDPYHIDFKQLKEQATAFQHSPAAIATEQHFVIKKFFVTLVSRARDTFEQCNKTTRSWFRDAVTPVYTQIQQHKVAIERRLETLKKVHQGMDNLGRRIAEFEGKRQGLLAEIQMAEQLIERLHRPLA